MQYFVIHNANKHCSTWIYATGSISVFIYLWNINHIDKGNLRQFHSHEDSAHEERHEDADECDKQKKEAVELW